MCNKKPPIIRRDDGTTLLVLVTLALLCVTVVIVGLQKSRAMRGEIVRINGVRCVVLSSDGRWIHAQHPNGHRVRWPIAELDP